MRGLVLRQFPLRFAAIIAVATTLCAASGHAEAPAPGGLVVVATYEGVINPVAAEYLHDTLFEAHTQGARALIIKLDTPGGLDTSMRMIIKDITAAPIPVVVYVAPSGGRAASAGTFITLAGHVAAMAPGTSIGAAHPVAMGGGEMDKTMNLQQIIDQLDLNVLTAPRDFAGIHPTGGYSSDLLSCVMAGAKKGYLWITLQAHLNIVAVAALNEVAAIIITENAQPDAATIAKANQQDVILLSTPLATFEINGRLWELGIGSWEFFFPARIG